MDDPERLTMVKVWRRVVPLMIVVLFFSYLLRVNIGFAALTMNADLGFSNTVFGTGAGIFAIGYALFAIPSTLILHRLGARRWISIILVAWSLSSAATAFVAEPAQLLGVRLVLGMAEAGFASAVVLTFNQWFPSRYRGRAFGSFFFILPLGLMIGGPVSSALLSQPAYFGLVGWQWLFVIEALPTLLLAPVVFLCLADGPTKARWLTSTEQRWLVESLASERSQVDRAQSGSSVLQTLTDTRVWILSAVFLAIGTSGLGAILFLPLMIQSMGFSVSSTGFVTMLPAAAAVLALPLWGIWTDRARHREIVVGAASCAIALGLLMTALLLSSSWAVLPISVALIGFYGCMAAFWTLPPEFLSGAGAAAGTALINIAGNFGSFSGPLLLGRTSDVTQSYAAGLFWLTAVAAGAGLVMIVQGLRKKMLPSAYDGVIRRRVSIRSS